MDINSVNFQQNLVEQQSTITPPPTIQQNWGDFQQYYTNMINEAGEKYGVGTAAYNVAVEGLNNAYSSTFNTPDSIAQGEAAMYKANGGGNTPVNPCSNKASVIKNAVDSAISTIENQIESLEQYCDQLNDKYNSLSSKYTALFQQYSNNPLSCKPNTGADLQKMLSDLNNLRGEINCAVTKVCNANQELNTILNNNGLEIDELAQKIMNGDASEADFNKLTDLYGKFKPERDSCKITINSSNDNISASNTLINTLNSDIVIVESDENVNPYSNEASAIKNSSDNVINSINAQIKIVDQDIDQATSEYNTLSIEYQALLQQYNNNPSSCGPNTKSDLAKMSQDLESLLKNLNSLQNQKITLDVEAKTIKSECADIDTLAQKIIDGDASKVDFNKLQSMYSQLQANQTVFNNEDSIMLSNFAQYSQVINTLNGDAAVVKADEQPINPPQTNAQNATYYEAWQISANNIPVPENVNSVYLAMGGVEMINGVLTVLPAGEGNTVFNNNDLTALKNWIGQCNAKGVKVYLTIGGNGGTYDNIWDGLLGSDGQVDPSKAQAWGQALASYCTNIGLSGIDFDWEEINTSDPSSAASLGNAVGCAIKDFKEDAPNLQTSIAVNGSADYWGQFYESLFDAAGKGNIDRVNVMDYYDSSLAEGFAESWGKWAEAHGMSNSQINITSDTACGLSSDQKLEQWAHNNGYGTNLWAFDAANTEWSNSFLPNWSSIQG